MHHLVTELCTHLRILLWNVALRIVGFARLVYVSIGSTGKNQQMLAYLFVSMLSRYAFESYAIKRRKNYFLLAK